jgi:hypothetical protein
MADDQGETTDKRARSAGLEAFLFLLALGTALLAVASTFVASPARGEPSGVACAIVSAGAFIALAIERSR